MTPRQEVVVAASWRLWMVQDDSLRYHRELATTDSGFLLPDTGSWVVEAWSSAVAAGITADLSPQPLDDDFHRCLHWIGRNTSASIPQKATIGTCDELASPTVLSHGASQRAPSAIAAFRLPSPSASGYAIKDSTGHILSARAWRLWKFTGGTTGPLAMYRFAGYQSGGEPGVLEISGLEGTWVAQGWNAAPLDTLFRMPAFETGLESTLVNLCLDGGTSVMPKPCNKELFESSQYGNEPGQLRAPDAQVVFRLPAVR